MKLLGRWSLASFLKLMVDVPYYFLLVLLPLVFAGALWMLLTGHSGSIQFDIPVRFQLDPATHPFSSARSDIQVVAITDARGSLQFRGGVPSMAVAWAGLGYGIISLGVFLFVLNRLRAIFRTLRDQNPFVERNASRIRMIGIVLVAGQFASRALGALYAARIIREISVAGLTLTPDFSLNAWVILSGLILLMLAEVFRLGGAMKGELETARKIQFDLVPGEIFHKHDAVVHARMRPAEIVGGDLYDVLDLDDKRLALIVGDVTGKGLPAAMLMASVLGSVRALCSAGLRGRDLIVALNRHVCTTNNSGDRLVTLFYAELDTTTGQMLYVNAGHNSPILLHSNGQVERLLPTALVLGVKPDAVVESQQLEIKPDDRLLLFTDGFSEAFNKKNEEYGESRLTDSFLRVRMQPPCAVVDRLIADVLTYCGSSKPRDDMTLMVIAHQPV